jgi:hypothetical protein
MSQVNAVDPRVQITGQIEQAAHLLLVDLRHIPSDKLNVSAGGVARTPLAIVAECIGINDMIADVVGGTPRTYPTAEEQTSFAGTIDTMDRARNGIQESVQKLCNTVQGLSEAELDEMVTAPWGATYSRGGLAAFAATHLMYHDGQLNFIQALCGDGAVHWGES